MFLIIPTICIILFGVGEFIVARLSPQSWFVRWWRRYMSNDDPYDR
jgi:hypothetical protein